VDKPHPINLFAAPLILDPSPSWGEGKEGVSE